MPSLRREETLPDFGKSTRRSLMRGTGLSDEQMRKPKIGVVNSWGKINPAAAELGRLAAIIEKGITEGGCTPIQFSMSSMCVGSAGGGIGLNYCFPLRDLTAAYIEAIAELNMFDGLVFTSVCDDVVPAHLMAAARVNIPSIIVLGGYMTPGHYEGRDLIVADVGKAYVNYKQGLITEEKLVDMECSACTGAGACPVMGTANTMGAMAEALGIAFPGNSCVSGTDTRLDTYSYEAGLQICKLLEGNFKPSDIMTFEAFRNAIRVFNAVGGSTNAVLHLTAIAHELDINLELDLFEEIGSETPFICDVQPAGRHTMVALDHAGGIPSVLKELAPLLHLNNVTVTGKTLRENLATTRNLDTKVIRPISQPLNNDGGIVVVRGNISPNGCIVRQVAVPKTMLRHKGPARIFESEEDACNATLDNKLRPGDVVILRYQGPKGAPGMRICGTRFLWFLETLKLDKSVAFVTDGRFSGTCKGAAFGHVSPEAAEGGILALLEENDSISIDIPNRTLDVDLDEKELAKRRATWKPRPARFSKGILALYEKIAQPAEKGSILCP